MSFDDFAVGHEDVFKMGEVRLSRVLAVGHVGLDVHDDGVFELDGEVVLHGSRGRGAVELHLDLGQFFAAGQGPEQQGRGLVHDLGDLERLVHALSCRLARLGVARQDYLMLESFHQALVLVTFLVDVAHRGFGEVSGGDEPLSLSGDADVGWYWHVVLRGWG